MANAKPTPRQRTARDWHAELTWLVRLPPGPETDELQDVWQREYDEAKARGEVMEW